MVSRLLKGPTLRRNAKMNLKNVLGSLALVTAVSATGCVVRAHGAFVGPPPPVAVVEVEEEPPPPRQEVIEVRPGFVFIQGRWDRRGGQWVWMDGRWDRERAGQRWENGRWERRGNRHVYVEGRWQAGGGSRPAEEGPRVRDHRDAPPPPPPSGPIVRDHR
jgi:hypothetical protein